MQKNATRDNGAGGFGSAEIEKVLAIRQELRPAVSDFARGKYRQGRWRSAGGRNLHEVAGILCVSFHSARPYHSWPLMLEAASN